MGSLFNVLIGSTAMPAGVLVAISSQNLRSAGIFVICMILSIGVHEFAHAYAAHKLGDPVPEGQGRLTLNPIAHMDPIGTLALPLIMGLFAHGMLFGWGKPVETQPRNYTRKVTMRAGMALVAFAGPLSNLVQAAVALLLIFALSSAGVLDGRSVVGFDHPLGVYYYLNLILFAFNLLPIHPLDGGKVLAWLLGPKYQHIDDFLGQYGGMILIVLIVAPFALGVPSVLGFILGPIVALGQQALLAIVG
ncbi:MAG: site-2 protease family protein [Nannocystaceae bacterium]|nr:site-2 protease family protein [Nannocystaceae bacterium]